MSWLDIVSNVLSLGFGGFIGSLIHSLTVRSRCQIIAVFGTEVPPELRRLPLYTSYYKAKHCKYDLVVLLTRTLSFGLRKCDFVVAEEASDPKVIRPDNHDRLEALVSVDGVREF